MSVQPKLIISIAKARELLGEDGATLTDEEIEEVIIALTGIAATALRKPMVPENKQVLPSVK